MDLANMPLFAAITRKMHWLTERQRVLAENIANVDTPNYQTSDLRPLDFRKELAQTGQGQDMGLQPTVTNPMHLSTTATSGGDTEPVKTRKKDDVEHDINGNTVSLEDELMKVSETSADYQMITNLYKKQIGLLKTAIGRSGS